MICNHALSGESIKRARASAPLLRGLLLFYPLTPPTCTFDPSVSPFSFQAPTKYPRTWAAVAAGGGACEGSEGGRSGVGGGGFMAPLLIFHGPCSPMERVQERQGGAQQESNEDEEGVFKTRLPPSNTPSH